VIFPPQSEKISLCLTQRRSNSDKRMRFSVEMLYRVEKLSLN